MSEHVSSPSRALRAALSVPEIAWPTLALWAAVLVTWGTGAWAVGQGHGAAGAAVMTLCSYLAFTPMHDASHRAVARRAWVNDWVGRLSAMTLLGPFFAFRFVHLEHHKHTNDPARDPDLWSGLRPAWALPLRWLTQDLHYYAWYLPAGRPGRELAEVLLTLALYGAACAWSLAKGQGALVLAWVVSSRLALMALSFGFDYLPHWPHDVTSAEDRFRATRVRPGVVLQVLLVNQNLHLVHHLTPAVPFYRYGTLWREQREQLLACGAQLAGRDRGASTR